MRFSAKAAALAFAVFIGAGSASAATIDVDNLLEGPILAGASGLAAASTVSPEPGLYSGQALQNWTVTKSGRLERIDIFGDANGATSVDGVTFDIDTDFLLTLTILSGGTEWSPGNLVLGAVTKSVSELGASRGSMSSFDLSGLGISAAQGDLLTFRMSVETCPQIAYCNFNWGSWHTIAGVGTTNGYEGGRAFTQTQSGLYAWDYDLNFRTWTSAVPEPGTWALMIMGFGAVGAMVRASRKSALQSS